MGGARTDRLRLAHTRTHAPTHARTHAHRAEAYLHRSMHTQEHGHPSVAKVLPMRAAKPPDTCQMPGMPSTLLRCCCPAMCWSQFLRRSSPQLHMRHLLYMPYSPVKSPTSTPVFVLIVTRRLVQSAIP
jgi:hypothetical protein